MNTIEEGSTVHTGIYTLVTPAALRKCPPRGDESKRRSRLMTPSDSEGLLFYRALDFDLVSLTHLERHGSRQSKKRKIGMG